MLRLVKFWDHNAKVRFQNGRATGGDDVAGPLGQSPSPLGTAVVEERERDIARAPPAERRLKERMAGARAVSARRLTGTDA